MADRSVTAQWAWISKEPKRRDYEILASSDSHDAIRPYAERYLTGFPRGTDNSGADAPPWLVFGSFLEDEPGPLISVSVTAPRQDRDIDGRPVWSRRFFLLRYNELAAVGASYRGLWGAVQPVSLPAPDRMPLSLELQTQSLDELVRAVETYGRDRMIALAALVLEGQVALTGASDLSVYERLALADALAALLPYGVRAALSFSSAADAGAGMAHRVRLLFAEPARYESTESTPDQIVVSLSAGSPIPDPQTPTGRNYRDLLREMILAFGTQAVIEYLWAARTPRSLAQAEDALEILRDLQSADLRQEIASEAPPRSVLTTRYDLWAALSDLGPEASQRVYNSLRALRDLPSEVVQAIGREADEGIDNALQALRDLPPEVVQAIRREADETAAVQAEIADRERVQFTTTHPGILMPGIWYPLYVHVHRDGIRDQLETRLAELDSGLGPRPRRAETPANSMIPPGTELEIQPVIASLRCRPPRMPVVWNEELEEAVFEVGYAGPAGASRICRGSVLVFANSLLIAQIPVSFTIEMSSDVDFTPGPQTASAVSNR